MITPTQLYVRFLKENKIYKPLMVYRYFTDNNYNNKRYFYYGIIEDRLNYKKILVKNIFPELVRCGPPLVDKWKIYLKQYQEEEINYIPKPSVNYNTILDILLEDFQKTLIPHSKQDILCDKINEKIDSLNDKYALCKLMRQYNISVGGLIQFFNTLLTINSNEIKLTLEKLWIVYLYDKNVNIDIVF